MEIVQHIFYGLLVSVVVYIIMIVVFLIVVSGENED